MHAYYLIRMQGYREDDDGDDHDDHDHRRFGSFESLRLLGTNHVPSVRHVSFTTHEARRQTNKQFERANT